MTIVAGCDVGSLTTKAVILKNRRLAGSAIIRSGPRPAESARKVMADLLSETGLVESDLDFCVGTGYGRSRIPFVSEAVSEISCHGRGAQWLVPSVRTVIDIGGQDCKVMRLSREGSLVKFVTNDKCASGTGRFLDVMAKVMNIDIAELGRRSLTSTSPIVFASMCTVWAQADVIKHINARKPPEDICAGINTAMANRVSMLVSSLSVEDDICMTGGVAKNEGVVRALSKLLGKRIKPVKRADPQLIGAIGAALFAHDRVA